MSINYTVTRSHHGWSVNVDADKTAEGAPPQVVDLSDDAGLSDRN